MYKRQELGIPHRVGVAKTGIVGLIEGGKPGKTLLLRADMDALPLQEGDGVPYCSLHPGVMHACGHDAHMTVLLGAAELLMACREQLRGSVKLVFQPGEEASGGAQPMIEAVSYTHLAAKICLTNHANLCILIMQMEGQYFCFAKAACVGFASHGVRISLRY